MAQKAPERPRCGMWGQAEQRYQSSNLRAAAAPISPKPMVSAPPPKTTPSMPSMPASRECSTAPGGQTPPPYNCAAALIHK